MLKLFRKIQLPPLFIRTTLVKKITQTQTEPHRHTLTHTRTDTETQGQRDTHTQKQGYTHIDTHTNTYTYRDTHTLTHTHTHTPTQTHPHRITREIRWWVEAVSTPNRRRYVILLQTTLVRGRSFFRPGDSFFIRMNFHLTPFAKNFTRP